MSTEAGFVFSGTEVVFTQHKKRCKKQHFTFLLFSVAFAQFVLQYQGCNTITLNPSLHSELDVILMQRSNFDKLLSCDLSRQNQNCFIFSPITTGAKGCFVWLIAVDSEESGRQKTNRVKRLEEFPVTKGNISTGGGGVEGDMSAHFSNS